MKTLLIALAVIAIIIVGYELSIILSAHDYALNQYHGWYKCVHDARELGVSIADVQLLSDTEINLAYQMIDSGYEVSAVVDGQDSLIRINDHAGQSYENYYKSGQLIRTAIKAIPVI